MQTWRGCLPVIGDFTELQERHARTKTSEPGIISEHSESERPRGNVAQTINTECHAISDNSERLPFVRNRRACKQVGNGTAPHRVVG
jgi:hypothetical protein